MKRKVLGLWIVFTIFSLSVWGAAVWVGSQYIETFQNGMKFGNDEILKVSNGVPEYEDASGNVKRLDDGSLDVFYFEDFEGGTDETDFSCGNNATFLGGGTVDGTPDIEVTTVIKGSNSFEFTNGATPANTLDDYCASPIITLDSKEGDGGKTIGINFWYTYSGSDDEVTVVIYDDTNNAVISSSLDLLEASTDPQRFSTSFYVPDAVSELRWGFHYKTTPATGSSILRIDDVELTLNPFAYKDLVKVNSITLEGNGGETVSGSPIPFAGSGTGWDGDEYTVQYNNSVIDVNFSVLKNAASSRGYDLYINDVLYRKIETDEASVTRSEGMITIAKGETSVGDVIEIRPSSSITLTNTASEHWLTITETQDSEENIVSSGSKGVEEYFANTASATRPSSNGYSVTFTNVVINTLGDYATITNDATSGIVLTALRPIEVQAEGVFADNASTMTFGFLVNGNSSISFTDNANDDIRRGTTTTNGIAGINNIAISSFTINTGDTVKLSGSTNGTVYTGSVNELQRVRFLVRPKEIEMQGAIPATRFLTDSQETQIMGSNTANTFTDSGLTLNLGVGRWNIRATVPLYMDGATGTGASGRFGNITLTDSSNTVLDDINGTAVQNVGAFANSSSPTVYSVVSIDAIVDITTEGDYKIRFATKENTGTSTTIANFVVRADPNYATATMIARKIR